MQSCGHYWEGSTDRRPASGHAPPPDRDEPTERAVRRRVLDEAGIPYVLVRLPPDWRLKEDRHPDPRGARAIADAIASALVTRRA